jgi:hypothetical protein
MTRAVAGVQPRQIRRGRFRINLRGQRLAQKESDRLFLNHGADVLPVDLSANERDSLCNAIKRQCDANTYVRQDLLGCHSLVI